jgi:hypothetical protein
MFLKNYIAKFWDVVRAFPLYENIAIEVLESSAQNCFIHEQYALFSLT